MGSIICSILPMASVPLHMAKPVLCPHPLMATEGQNTRQFRPTFLICSCNFFLSSSIEIEVDFSCIVMIISSYSVLLAISFYSCSLSLCSVALTRDFPPPLSPILSTLSPYTFIQHSRKWFRKYTIWYRNLQLTLFPFHHLYLAHFFLYCSQLSLFFVIHSFLVTTIINVTGKTKANMIDFKSNQV